MEFETVVMLFTLGASVVAAVSTLKKDSKTAIATLIDNKILQAQQALLARIDASYKELRDRIDKGIANGSNGTLRREIRDAVEDALRRERDVDQQSRN